MLVIHPWVRETCWLYTRGWEEDPGVYTRGWEEDPGVYTRVYMVGIHFPIHRLGTPPWVHHGPPTRSWSYSAVSTPRYVAQRGSPGLRGGETPGWDSLRTSQNPKGVKVGGRLCAELLRSSREN